MNDMMNDANWLRHRNVEAPHERRSAEFAPAHHRTMVQYDGFPAALLRDFKALSIPEIRWLMPRWCASLTFRYIADSDEEAVILQVFAKSEYGRATIEVHPCFFEIDRDDEYRRVLIIHELMHLNMWLLSEYTKEMVKRLIDKPLRDEILEQIRERDETVTTELAALLASRFAQKKRLRETEQSE